MARYTTRRASLVAFSKVARSSLVQMISALLPVDVNLRDLFSGIDLQITTLSAVFEYRAQDRNEIVCSARPLLTFTASVDDLGDHWRMVECRKRDLAPFQFDGADARTPRLLRLRCKV
ncbi:MULTISPECIES: hypothetical protein [Sphingomonas]|uniref:hypothetical protein n=1 Tax=Sphingomonas TaxID=13687 RepID=UPI0012E357D6|nr:MULTISPECIES: hypothetical protein [Sphingomonas]MBY0301223.1 hypothetical protein [Sphingomonas ginsenosidimutans]